MKSFIIAQNDAGQRLDKFLTKAVPLLPKNLMYKYLRLKRIKLNGKKSEISTRLCIGDELSLYINDEFFGETQSYIFLQAPNLINIIYEDDNILLVDKNAGLCVHEDNAHTIDTLINRVLHYLYEKGEYSPENELSFIPALCNRIDRNTTGIVMVAKNAEALRILNEKIKNREIKKFYLCVADGIVSPREATLTHFLLRRENESLVTVSNSPSPLAKTIITKYRVLKTGAANSLLEVELKTGRTHQIRAHLAYIGHPIIGDGKYGSNRINREYGQKHQLLHSYRLVFDFDDTDLHLLSYLNKKEFFARSIWFSEEFEKNF